MIYSPILKYHEGSADYMNGDQPFICAAVIKEIYGRTPATIRFEISEQPRTRWKTIYVDNSLIHWIGLWINKREYMFFHKDFRRWILDNLEGGTTYYWVRMVTDV